MSADVIQDARNLLDRGDELDILEAALAQASAGEGRVLLIEGPPGIGKTVLLDELRRRGRERQMDVHNARGGELEGGFGFGVVRQLLEARLAGAVGEDRTRLLAGAARLAEPLFSADPRVDDDGGEVAFATLHGLYWLVVNMAERGPLVLCVDDVHWADEPSLRFLLHLAHRLAGLPVVLALTMRTGADRHRLEMSSLRLEAQAPIVRPRPLGTAAVASLVGASLGVDASPALCRACAEATDGNPFLLSELLGELRRDARPPGEIDPGTVLRLAPERIAAALLLRVSHLDPAAPALARSVAVLGDQAGLVNCARLADLDPARARMLAAALAGLAVLQRDEPLRFVHPIVRTVIYEDIPAVERGRLHAGAARLLAYSADPREIAVHLLATDPSGDREVVSLLRDAARRALSSGAPDTAAALLRRALAEPPEEHDRPLIVFELGTAEHEIGDQAAPRHLREAGETASDPIVRARALIALAWATHTDPARQREQIPLYERAAEDVGGHDRELALHLEAARLGGLLFNPDLPVRFEEEAERFCDLPADSAAESLLLSFVARSALAGHTVAEAGDLAERAASHPAMTSQAGHPLWRTNVTFCLIAAERYDVAERMLSGAVRHAERAGSPQWITRALWLRGATRHRRGDLRGAEGDLRAAVDAQGLTYIHHHHTVLFPLIDVLTDGGRLEEAEAVLLENGLDGDLASPVPMTIWGLIVRGRLRASQGDLATARIDLEGALRRLKVFRGLLPWDHDARMALVPVLHASGDDESALALADEALAAATAVQSRRAVGSALRVRGLVIGGKEGLDLLAQAVATLTTSPAQLSRAEALIDLGAALRRDGQSSRARSVLREGMDLAHQCAALPLVGRAADELRAAGGRPHRQAGTGVNALTASERRVAELAATGMKNKEIAQSLFVTLRTVEMHLSGAYGKLGISSRQGLARALQG